ncbi:MAG: chemotaxis protein CheW [Nitrospirae bacterium]|nr:chemotaxis protein CheW [Nitrospirota bacterium]MCL5422874.1 chemotaxis protein CheW [Nitrospirota bacterium]
MPKVAVVFAGEEEFGIDIGKVVEILKAQRVYLLPQLPPFLSGVVNIRGEVIPLMDLRKRFGIESSSAKERIIVIRSDGEKVGLLVDGVKEIVTLQPEEIISPPAMFKGLRMEYMTGLGRRGNSIIIFLNLDTLLTSEEKIQLGAVAKTMGVDHAGDEKISQ